MSDERLTDLYSKAESDLANARGELYKPEEDVVKYSACISARSALYHYLGCLYVLNEDDVDYQTLVKGSKSIEELIESVSEYNTGVGKIDFNPMRCKCNDIEDVLNNEEIYFCNNTEIVRSCTELAEQVRELVISDVFDGTQPEIESSK